MNTDAIDIIQLETGEIKALAGLLDSCASYHEHMDSAQQVFKGVAAVSRCIVEKIERIEESTEDLFSATNGGAK